MSTKNVEMMIIRIIRKFYVFEKYRHYTFTGMVWKCPKNLDEQDRRS